MSLLRAAKLLLPLGLMVLLVGCTTGANFPAPKARAFVMGSTTTQQVIETFGPPQKQEVQTKRRDIGDNELPASMVLTTLFYDYTEPPGSQGLGTGRPWRRAFLYFHEDKLVGYFQTSNFVEDATKFNMEKVTSLQKQKTSEQEVIAALGAPSGRGIYPLALSRDGRSLFYNFAIRKGFEVVIQDAKVFLSADGVVQDFSVTSDTKSQPQGGAVTIPIYIPRR